MWHSQLSLFNVSCLSIIAGISEKHHSDPILAKLGILKIGDLYRQQLRLHAWSFWNGKLPESQEVLLNRVSDIHEHHTRPAGSGFCYQTQDHRSVGYRVPKEWDSATRAGGIYFRLLVIQMCSS